MRDTWREFIFTFLFYQFYMVLFPIILPISLEQLFPNIEVPCTCFYKRDKVQIISLGRCLCVNRGKSIKGLHSIYLSKVNNGNTKAMCEICSKLTIKKSERRQWCRSVVFIVNFEQISRVASLLPLQFRTCKCRLKDQAFANFLGFYLCHLFLMNAIFS